MHVWKGLLSSELIDKLLNSITVGSAVLKWRPFSQDKRQSFKQMGRNMELWIITLSVRSKKKKKGFQPANKNSTIQNIQKVVSANVYDFKKGTHLISLVNITFSFTIKFHRVPLTLLAHNWQGSNCFWFCPTMFYWFLMKIAVSMGCKQGFKMSVLPTWVTKHSLY